MWCCKPGQSDYTAKIQSCSCMLPRTACTRRRVSDSAAQAETECLAPGPRACPLTVTLRGRPNAPPRCALRRAKATAHRAPGEPCNSCSLAPLPRHTVSPAHRRLGCHGGQGTSPRCPPGERGGYRRWQPQLALTRCCTARGIPQAACMHICSHNAPRDCRAHARVPSAGRPEGGGSHRPARHQRGQARHLRVGV
jgi:hypothetical protein